MFNLDDPEESVEKIIAEMSYANTLTLSPTQWEQLVRIMEAPIQLNENLKRAFRESMNDT